MPDDPEISLRQYIERIIDEREKQYFEKINAIKTNADEREKRYIDKFDAIETNTARALAAITTDKRTAEWSAGTLIAIIIGLLSAAMAAIAIFRH